MRELQVVLPVHNEGRTIDGTLAEWHEALREIDHEFVVCEDGSTDDTVSVLRAAAAHLPLVLISDTRRKGYTRAAIDALTPKLRDTLLLAASGEHGYDEIAAMLGVPVGTVKWRVAEARKLISARCAVRGA